MLEKFAQLLADALAPLIVKAVEDAVNKGIADMQQAVNPDAIIQGIRGEVDTIPGQVVAAVRNILPHL